MQVVLDDYVWAAGIATDLVNTASEVWRGGGDRLPDPAALIEFVTQHPAPSRALDAVTESVGEPLAAIADTAHRDDLLAVHELRTTVRDLIDHPQRDYLIAGASALTTSARGASLLAAPEHDTQPRWTLQLGPDAGIADALAVISGVGVLGVVRTLGEQRFRPCGAPTCRGAFIDTTRPGRRRYCMPGLCGNRINVANHRARRAARHDPL